MKVCNLETLLPGVKAMTEQLCTGAVDCDLYLWLCRQWLIFVIVSTVTCICKALASNSVRAHRLSSEISAFFYSVLASTKILRWMTSHPLRCTALSVTVIRRVMKQTCAWYDLTLSPPTYTQQLRWGRKPCGSWHTCPFWRRCVNCIR